VLVWQQTNTALCDKENNQLNQPIVKFRRIMPSAIEPMRADKSALGSIPAAALQYCEALRSASSYGWYAFPPHDVQLRWDGAEIFFLQNGKWEVLRNVVDAATIDLWQQKAPAEHTGKVPPFLSRLFVPGLVQIWTGLVVQTSADWNILVRPLANVITSKSYLCYEGIIESDWFAPVPLFINLRLLTTDQVITLPRNQPLFQVQPVSKTAYTDACNHSTFTSLASTGTDAIDEQEWEGLVNTLRSISPDRPHDIGRYGATVRKKSKTASPD
jgi:Family of unknown function (DUF6065)